MDVNDEQLPQEEQTQITTFQDYIPKQQVPTKQQMSYFSQFVIFIGLTGGGLVVAGIVSLIVFFAMKGGGSLSSFSEAEMLKPENANVIKVIQVVSTLFVFLTPAFFFGLIANGKPFNYLGFNKKVSLKQLGLVILVACTGLFLSGVLAKLNQIIPIGKETRGYFQTIEDKGNEQILALLQLKSFADYIVGLIIIALAPAFLEELFFRGALQNLLTKWTEKPWLAIAITSIVFSAIHFSYFGFLPRAMLGAVLGLLFYYSKSIWPSILAHFLNNAIAVSQIYGLSLAGKIDKKALLELDKTQLVGWQIALLGIVSATAMIVWLYYFKKESNKTLAQHNLETA